MNKVNVVGSVFEATEKIKILLQEKGFTIFGDIDHQENAKNVGLDMPASRVLIFGNPVAGTKLMQEDIAISLDLPTRIAIVDDGGTTKIIYPSKQDFYREYDVEGHPVLDKIDDLFTTLVSEITAL